MPKMTTNKAIAAREAFERKMQAAVPAVVAPAVQKKRAALATTLGFESGHPFYPRERWLVRTAAKPEHGEPAVINEDQKKALDETQRRLDDHRIALRLHKLVGDHAPGDGESDFQWFMEKILALTGAQVAASQRIMRSAFMNGARYSRTPTLEDFIDRLEELADEDRPLAPEDRKAWRKFRDAEETDSAAALAAAAKATP